jgi:hypothetical protein
MAAKLIIIPEAEEDVVQACACFPYAVFYE